MKTQCQVVFKHIGQTSRCSTRVKGAISKWRRQTYLKILLGLNSFFAFYIFLYFFFLLYLLRGIPIPLILSLLHKIPADDKKERGTLIYSDNVPSVRSATVADPSPNSDTSLSPF